jgi:hypothetical protein
MPIGHPLTVTRRVAPGSRSDEAPAEPAAQLTEGSEAAEAEAEPEASAEPEVAADPGAPSDDAAETGEPSAETEGPPAEEEPPVEEEPGIVEEPGEAEDPGSALVASLRRVRAELSRIRFPLAVPGADAAAAAARTLLAQLDDYLLPRLARLDAPLLVVVGGSTGAGKSTLVNSMVRAPVSQAGVLRPTTRAPVLVSAPGDMPWFLGPSEPGTADADDVPLLPNLRRTTGLQVEAGALRVISAPGLTRGMALLDAPDLDSVVKANRDLADELLGAADLWLFVTTAARYADAVPWTSLRAARDRGTRLALLLNRVPEGAEEEIRGHLGELLDGEGLAGTTLFVLPEVVLDGQGLLTEQLVAPIGDWLGKLAEDPPTRVRVIGDTLGGALAALRWGAEELARALDRQHAALTGLREQVREGYAAALATVETTLADGALLRGEVLGRWREFVDSGEFAAVLRGRRRFGRGAAGEPGGGRLLAALTAALATLIIEVRAQATDRVRAAWASTPAGVALLAEERTEESAEVRADRTRVLVREWETGVVAGADGTGMALLAVLRVLGGEPPLDARDRSRLRGVLGQRAVRTLADNSRDDLLARTRAVLDADAATFTAQLAAADGIEATAERLRAALTSGEAE